MTRPVENRAAVIFRARRAREESFTVFPPPARRTPERMPAMESALETSAMMSGQLVASATVSSMLISLPLGRIPRHSAATGHEPVLGPDRGTEVDARARAAVLRAAPTNRELTVRADRRERAEKLRQARHSRAEDDVQVAVHGQTITTTFFPG